jgi:hypothetical protein
MPTTNKTNKPHESTRRLKVLMNLVNIEKVEVHKRGNN